MGEKRKAPKGCYWRGDTLWGRFEVQGVEHRRSLRTGEAKVAETRLKEFRDKQVAASRFGSHRTKWADAFLSWSDHIVGHTKLNTRKRYNCSLKQIEPFVVDLYVDEIDKAVVNTIVKRRRALAASNATIKRDLVALSSVLGHCQDEGWIEGNPALDRMKRLKERRDPIVLPEPAHIEAVIARAPGTFAAMIRCAWLTGCRQDELRRLERPHLDFVRAQISLYRTKTGRPRVIDMRDAEAVLAKIPVALHSKVVFWHSGGEPYLNIASNFRRLVESARISAQRTRQDFRPFRFHDLRHLFAVEFLKKGGGIYDLQKHLGHTSLSTTEIYLKYLTPDEDRNVKSNVQQSA